MQAKSILEPQINTDETQIKAETGQLHVLICDSSVLQTIRIFPACAGFKGGEGLEGRWNVAPAEALRGRGGSSSRTEKAGGATEAIAQHSAGPPGLAHLTPVPSPASQSLGRGYTPSAFQAS